MLTKAEFSRIVALVQKDDERRSKLLTLEQQHESSNGNHSRSGKHCSGIGCRAD
jgi:hypothetical protein